MSGISSSVGLISGIDTAALIDQLMQIEAQPKVAIQRRVLELQQQQAAYLDLNSRLSALRTASSKFRTDRVFDAARAVTSNSDVMTATVQPGATVGDYTFIADRLVSTKQVLSAGYANNSTAMGATSITFESDSGRLDRDTELSELNGGAGIARGKISITDARGNTAQVDLSRAGTVNEVLSAINSAGISVRAKVSDDHFVIEDTSSGGTQGINIQSVTGYTTAESLKINHTAVTNETSVTGGGVYRLTSATKVTSLNDRNGIRINSTVGTGAKDFTIRVGSTSYNVNLGNVYNSQAEVTGAAVTTLGDVIQRINDATGGAVTATINAAGTGLDLSGSSAFTVADVSGAAADLGIVASSDTTSVNGRRLIAGMNSTLVSNLRGGSGLSAGNLSITTRSGAAFSLTLSTTGSVSDWIQQVQSATSGAVTLGLDETGTGLTLTDNTTPTSGAATLTISGTAATELGLANAGTTSSTVDSSRLQHRYVSESTLLSSMNGGRGVGTGTIELTDSTGRKETVQIGADSRSIGDVIKEINSRQLNLRARINDNGDGIIIEQSNPGAGGTTKLKIRDVSGTVAASLNIAGESAATGASNKIDGSFEKKVTLEAGDTLQDIVTKVNAAGVGVRASIVNDGTSTSPFHLSFTATRSGREGRFTASGQGIDLGLTELADGHDARAFFGNDDPAAAVLLTSSTNTITGVVAGLSVDLKGTSATPISVSVSSDTQAVHDAVNLFVDAYNTVIEKIDSYSTYDQDTKRRGILLGDNVSQGLRASLYSLAQGTPTNVSGQYQRLAQIGITFDGNGQLQLDSTRLDAALSNDPQAVKDLLTSRVQNPRSRTEISPGVTVANTGPDTYSSLGLAERMANFANDYLDPISGRFSQTKQTLDDQISLQNDRITNIDDRISRKRAILQQQFLNMEKALGQLQNQQNSLKSLTG